MKQLQLSGKNQHVYALVDDDDYEKLASHKWYLHGRGYVESRVKGKTIYLHRLVAQTPGNLHTDHINWNKLDNRKENLRHVTNLENQQNRPPRERGSINKIKSKGYTYYVGCIKKDRKKYYTTSCDTIEQTEGALKQLIVDKELTTQKEAL